MLSKSHCLKNKKDFERVYKKGRVFKGDFLFLKTLKNDLDYPRIGVVVSRKVALKATERNLIKRRIREAVRKRLLEMKKDTDIVIVAGKSISKKTSFQEIDKDIRAMFLKARLIKD